MWVEPEMVEVVHDMLTAGHGGHSGIRDEAPLHSTPPKDSIALMRS
ncbi:hypothetical protein [Nitrospina gracilis]|nr:hypothetical protein [Nitrospina gracilis]MCF8719318.1 hypothetical protein [Nitrospina gracilis Nb-211]